MEAQIVRNGVVRYGETYLLNDVQVAHYWPQIEECLEADHTWRFTHTKESLQDEILSHKMRVWAAGHEEVLSVIVLTQVTVCHVAKSLFVYWVFGNDAIDLLPLMDAALEKYAVHCGCSRMEGSGRRGWERALKNLGVRYLASTYWRPVGEYKEN